MRQFATSAIVLFSAFGSAGATAGTVYFNDFETPATAFAGLSAGGTIAALATTSLPTDGGGISSPHQSRWLGRVGAGVAKSASTTEQVTLQLGSLTPGATYSVSFDLLIGASWDGSANSYGPDLWSARVSSGASTATLVDATFSNCGPTICGADSRQSYSVGSPTAGASGPLQPVQTGAAFAIDTIGDYSQDYSIYYFGHDGGPQLSFVAGASTATLLFERGVVASGDSGDEYWALDNVKVASPVPVPATALLFAPACAGLLASAVRRRRG